jgi:hypothetical protein
VGTRHHQTQIASGEAATADSGIVELVRFAWRHGAATLYSCEQDGDRAYIAFGDGDSLQVFVDELAALARAHQQWGLLAHMARTPALCHPGPLPPFENCWSYDVELHGPITRTSPTLMLFTARIPLDDLVTASHLVAAR